MTLISSFSTFHVTVCGADISRRGEPRHIEPQLTNCNGYSHSVQVTPYTALETRRMINRVVVLQTKKKDNLPNSISPFYSIPPF